MTLTVQHTSRRFVTRTCGHRVPSGRKTCPYCTPPRLAAAPLAEAFRQRARRVGSNQMSLEIATRLGMEFGEVHRHIRKIVAGDVRKVSLETADRYCTALGGDSAAALWGQEWQDANPIEPYGDEDLG